MIVLFVILMPAAYGQNRDNNYLFFPLNQLVFSPGYPEPMLIYPNLNKDIYSVISNKKGEMVLYTNGYNFYNRYHNKINMQERNYFYSAIIPYFDSDSLYISIGSYETSSDTSRMDSIILQIIDAEYNHNEGQAVKSVVCIAPYINPTKTLFYYDFYRVPGEQKYIGITSEFGRALFSFTLDSNLKITAVDSISSIYKVRSAVWDHFTYNKKRNIIFKVANLSDSIYAQELMITHIDSLTGKFSNTKHFMFDSLKKGEFGVIYDSEISPNGSKIYCTSTYFNEQAHAYYDRIFQLDMDSLTENGKVVEGNTVFEAKSDPDIGFDIKRMFLGPDGEIYIGIHYYDNQLQSQKYVLANINFPDAHVKDCGFTLDNINMNTRFNHQVFPYVYQDDYLYFYVPDSLVVCDGDPLDIVPYFNEKNNYLEVEWSGAGFIKKNPELHLPKMNLSNTGMYYIKVKYGNFTISDSVYVIVADIPEFSINSKPIKPKYGDVVTLTPTPTKSTYVYSWNTGDSTKSINVTKSGVYSLTIANYGKCPTTENIQIVFPLLPDTISVCSNNHYELLPINNYNFNYDSLVWIYKGKAYKTDKFIINFPDNSYNGLIILKAYHDGIIDRDTTFLFINPSPEFTINTSSALPQKGDIVTLSVSLNNPGDSYLWNTKQTARSIEVTQNGLYSCTVVNKYGCSKNDSISVVFDESHLINLVGDKTLCEGDSATLIIANPLHLNVKWSNGNSGDTLCVNKEGDYWAYALYNGDYVWSDTIKVVSYKRPQIIIGGTAVLCEGVAGILSVKSNEQNVSYLWSNGSTADTTVVNTPGTYWVTVTNANGCSSSDTILVTIADSIKINLSAAQRVICGDETVEISAPQGYATYLWNTGETSGTIKTSSAGKYWVSVISAGGCNGLSDTVTIEKYAKPEPKILGSTTLCAGDTTILSADSDYASYLWSNGATAKQILVKSPGTYTLEVTNEHGCRGTAEITVKLNDAAPLQFANNIEFVDVLPNQNYQKQLQIRNTNNFNVKISYCGFDTGSDCSVSMTDSIVPANGLLSITINCTPKNEGTNFEYLLIKSSQICSYLFTKILISAKEISTLYKASLIAPDTTMYIDNKTVTLNFRMQTEENKVFENLSGRVVFTIDESVFKINSFNNATVRDKQIINYLTKYSVDVAPFTANNNSVPFGITGYALLADSRFTAVDILEHAFTNDSLQVKEVDGGITTRLPCLDPLINVIFFKITEVKAKSTLVKTALELNIDGATAGLREVRIYNYAGEVVSRTLIANNGSAQDYTIDLSSIASGIYFYEVSYGSAIEGRGKVVINK